MGAPASWWHTTHMQPSMLPSFALANVPAVSLQTVLAIVITLVFIWWAVFTLVSMYHWFRFERSSWVAVPSIALHFVVSIWIFIFATGGFH